jgi:uncharacterized integral membrane protein (TIGR00698 family)
MTASGMGRSDQRPAWFSRFRWRGEWNAGLLLAATIGVAASLFATLEERALGHALIEVLVLALLIGVVARNLLPDAGPFIAGTGFAAKQVLELGVGLLGASVDFRQVLAAGPALLTLVLIGVFGGLAANYLIGRSLRLSTKLAILVAVGNAICGNSAIAAVAPVIRAEKRDVASAIALTAVLGVCLVLALPLFLTLFGLSHYQYGVLAGMSVYAVPQVVAAAFPVSQLSGQVATLVKLTRVLLLGPAVVLFAILARRMGEEGEVRRGIATYVPWFVALFLVLAAARSAGILPVAVADPLRQVSRWLTILAMAGLGFGVELAAIRKVGVRVGVAVTASLLVMTAVTLVLLRGLGIDG